VSTFTGQVSGSTNDGVEDTTNAVTLTSASDVLKSTIKQWWAGRIQNVTVPGSATISAMSLSLFVPSGGNVQMDCGIHGNKVANPGALQTTSAYISGLAVTTASVTWNTNLTANQFNASPDISSIGTELIGQGGWASGNAMLFQLAAQSSTRTVTVEEYDGVAADAAEISITYTSGSPPGAPAGLTATYNSPSSLNLAWTQGSGTVTDNKVQYSTDNSTWTTVDIGSAATSYTLTGLTPNTLYYVQVAAANSGGTSAYSYYAYWPTQLTNSVTVTLSPIADVTTTGWSNVGGAGSFHAALTDASDSTYATPPANTTGPLMLTLQNPPANLICVQNAYLNYRAKTTNAGDTAGPMGSFYQSDGVTVLASISGTQAITTSFQNYTPAIFGTANSGQQGLTQWTAARVAIYAGDSAQDAQMSEASVTLQYLVPIGIVLPGVVSSQTLTGGRSLRALQRARGGVAMRSPFNPALGPLPTHIVGRFIPVMGRRIDGYEVKNL
jgi:hypothetical protein